MNKTPLLLAVSLLAAAPAQADYSDDFTNLDGWSIWTSGGAFNIGISPNDGNPGPAMWVSETGSRSAHESGGIERRFDDVLAFHISFDWRANGREARHSTGAFAIVDADTGIELYHRYLIRGGLQETNWQHFNATDLTFTLTADGHQGPRNIYVRFMMRDSWLNNYQQNFWVDNFELTKSQLRETTVVPMLTDSFGAGTEPWTFYRPVGACQDAMGSRWDEQVGNPAPSIQVTGSYTYTGNVTCRYGVRRNIPVALPFVLRADWDLDVVTNNPETRPNITFALKDGDGRVIYTETYADLTDSFQDYRPFDLSEVVAGHEQLTLEIYSHASTRADNPGSMWVDNIAWTEPCDEPFSLYVDDNADGIGDPEQPHPLGAVWCYEMPGWAAQTENCEDTPDGFDNDADGFSVCDGDCDDRDPDLSPADEDDDGVSSCDGDCDDLDDRAVPGATEVPGDGIDNDCDPGTPDGPAADAGQASDAGGAADAGSAADAGRTDSGSNSADAGPIESTPTSGCGCDGGGLAGLLGLLLLPALRRRRETVG
jgi:hypothetical protein